VVVASWHATVSPRNWVAAMEQHWPIQTGTVSGRRLVRLVARARAAGERHRHDQRLFRYPACRQ